MRDALVDARDHFEYLLSLPVGTPVTYLESGRLKKKGLLAGASQFKGQPVLRIQTDRKGTSSLVTAERAGLIQLSGAPVDKLPQSQKGKNVFAQRDFLANIIARADLSDFATRSRLDCVLLGHLNLVEQEVKDTRFAFKTATGYCEGTLLDLLRCRSLLSDGFPYRSDLCSINVPDPGRKVADAIPSAVIFDGTTSFIQWRYDWQSSDWIVLLDRTSFNFAEAVEEVNKHFKRARIKDGGLPEPPAIPAGIEIMVYRAPRR